MSQEREYFINGIVQDGGSSRTGAVRNGVERDTANRHIRREDGLASYAFTSSPHAAAYAVPGMPNGVFKKKYSPGGVHDKTR